MVKYSCDVCGKNYSTLREAENCENKGLSAEVTPGLLLSHKNVEDGFLVVYGEVKKEGHERMYFAEEFLVWDSLIATVQTYALSSSKVGNLENFILSGDNSVKRVNELIDNGFRGSSLVKAYMERYGVEKLHNHLS